MTRARAGLLLAGIFLLGLVCGALGMGAFALHRMRFGGPHAGMERFIVNRLSRRLDLDASQRRVLEGVTHRTVLRLREVHEQVRPQVEAILDDAYREILPVLDPEQQKELERIHEKALERVRGRPGP